jgi:glycosyltransferase involved in cell wall biosynthesis
MQVALSVIIPAFNVENYIIAAIQSALDQSDIDVEVIVVDDGSTDRTCQRAASVSNDRLRIIRQPNAGPSAARNAGIRLARGEFIGFLDGDDLWYPNKAMRHVQVMKTLPEVDLTFAWWRVIDDGGRDTGRRGKPRQDRIDFEELMVQNTTGNCSTVVARKRAIEQAGFFDPDYASLADHHLWLRIARLRDRNILCVRDILSAYRMRAHQLTKDWPRMLREWERLMAEMTILEPRRVVAVATRAQARYARYLAYLAYESGDHPMARRFLREAVCLQPVILGDSGTWVTLAAVLCTVLPARVHDWLAATIKEFRIPVGRPR